MRQARARTANLAKGRGLWLLALAMPLAGAPAARADITNSATASAAYGATTVTTTPSTVAIPVAAAKPSMTVVKTASPTTGLKAGDVITYTYVVKNTGNVSIHNISLADLHNASGPAPLPKGETLTDVAPLNDSSDATANNGIWTTLAPGDSVTFTATYTVTQHDQDTLQ